MKVKLKGNKNYAKGYRDAIVEVDKIIDELYKKHSNKVSHTFIFLLKKELKGEGKWIKKKNKS